jgi:hypothetical protein
MSMRIGIVMNMIAPYTTPVLGRLDARPNCDVFVVYETPMERSRRWQPKVDLPYGQTGLRSWTFDLARLTVGAGFKTRQDTYRYVPKSPLAALSRSRATRRSRRAGDPGDDPRLMREPADPEDGEARIPKVLCRGYMPGLRQLHVLGGPTPLRATRA